MQRARRFTRVTAAAVIAMTAAILAGVLGLLPLSSTVLDAFNDAMYDAVYKLRKAESRQDQPIVLLEIDDDSLREVERELKFGWPWPRDGWGMLAAYLEKQGARCVVFDLLMSEVSAHGVADDEQLAEMLEGTKVPLVFAVGGSGRAFAPPVKRPKLLGETDITTGKVYRDYLPETTAGASLALQAVRAAGLTPGLDTTQPFLLRFHGPHRRADGSPIYTSLKASRAIFAAGGHEDPTNKLDPSVFKDRIVMIGPVSAGLYDLKSAPVAARYPGIEVHATAIDNLLHGQEVRAVAPMWRGGLILALCALVSGGVVLGRSAIWKGATVFAGVVVLIIAAIVPMRLDAMHWLAPSVPALGIAIATVCGLIWTYRIEDARARFLLKALGQCISKDVAQTLSTDPSQLAVGGQRREITVLFSDIEGFTDLTERLREGIEPVLNYYLAEMSHIAFAEDGTIDKFIGDAMMVFWNAPLDQADHAVRACRTALALVRRERELAHKLAEIGASHIRTRIGINTGPVIVGFFGSVERLSYTAIGDAVNLGARLEPANKLYGTQIMVAQATQRLAAVEMCFRPIDRLRVYGKTEPAEVYELLGECTDERSAALAASFAKAINAYYLRDWDAAEGILRDISSRFPGDQPTAALMARITSYRADPPPPDWDGVFTAKGK